MRSFQFRLARILRVREVEEQAARERFLAADRIARDAEARADAARDTLASALAELRDSQSEHALAPGFLVAAQNTLDELRRRRQSALDRARTQRLQASAEQTAWAERRRDVKGLERLSDRDRERWLAEMGRAEAQQLDEVGSMRAAARAREAASWETHSQPMNPGTSS